MTPAQLVTKWRTDAETLARYDARLAEVAARHADELAAALRTLDDEALDLAAAARESGYSVDRLRHLVSSGEIPNVGRKGAPRVKRGDLPRKQRKAAGSFDAAATARDIVRAPFAFGSDRPGTAR